MGKVTDIEQMRKFNDLQNITSGCYYLVHKEENGEVSKILLNNYDEPEDALYVETFCPVCNKSIKTPFDMFLMEVMDGVVDIYSSSVFCDACSKDWRETHE